MQKVLYSCTTVLPDQQSNTFQKVKGLISLPFSKWCVKDICWECLRPAET